MAKSGFTLLDETVQQTHEVLRTIETALGWTNQPSQAYAALRVVLHTLRDRLPAEEATDLAAQLPTFIRGVFYEGWRPAAVPQKMKRDEFLELVQNQLPFAEGNISLVVGAVLHSLQKYISQGEAHDILATLPRDLADMVSPFLLMS